MKKVYIKKSKINEDDAAAQAQAQQAAQTDQPADNTQNQQITGDPAKAFQQLQTLVNNLKAQRDTKIIALQKQIDQINADYSNAMLTHRKTAQKLNAELTAAGQPTCTLQESASVDHSSLPVLSSIKFSRKLFESVKGTSMVDKIMNLLYSAVEGAQVSNTPTNPEVFRSYARAINRYITTHGWSKDIAPKNHWDELAEYIRSAFKNGTKFSYTDSELDRIVDKIRERFSKSENLSWIFGNESNKK